MPKQYLDKESSDECIIIINDSECLNRNILNTLNEDSKNQKRFKITLPAIDKFNSSNNEIVCCNLVEDPLDLNLDLDAVMGLIKIDCFASGFEYYIDIDLDNMSKLNPHNTIKSSLTYMTDDDCVVKINSLPNLKIGSSNTKLGVIDFYVVILNKPLLNSFNNLHFKLKVFEFFQTHILYDLSVSLISRHFIKQQSALKDGKAYNTIKGSLQTSDFDKILQITKKILPNFQIALYCESYGNKSNSTRSDLNLVNILDKVKSVFKGTSSDELFLDLCISVRIGTCNVIFANNRFFKKLGIPPNYRPLLCDSIMNLNIKSSKENSRDDRILARYKSNKFNFYSSFKNLIPVNKIKPFASPATAALLFTSIYNCWITGDKFRLSNHIDNVYKSSLIDFEASFEKSCSFRLETRCLMRDSEIAINKISKLIDKNTFSFISSESFFRVVNQNLVYLANYIVNSGHENSLVLKTPDSLIISLLAEHISNEIFINGFNTCSFFPSRINKTIKSSLVRSNNKLDCINIDFAVKNAYKLLNNSDKKSLLIKVIKYSSSISEAKKELFNQLLEIYYSKN